ncbi:response regulator [Paenibacillus dokdonensis]|uniref:Response regulator n=1 Tax=Paenibacillus dokdonensis TaxID=2567944 RepID=A0ABU6GJZ2_9BACL|nr:helix-turn-helix domain-containing protein [Paenibacillus dokdonensis]MEC0238556.1 response regulator [Paenibacillus dokdonensis]
MNALLVDDDYFVVTALEKKIDWKALSIENIFTAYNVSQAREILQQHPVHILICDIEMPQGNGLELLAWIREEEYIVQTIFLTNYADFNYAQKAIELQSFDYFLKPIEFDKLTLIIRKAVSKANEEKNIEKAIKEGYLWKKNQNKIVEHFWRKLISGKTFPSDPAVIAHSIADQNLSYQISDMFLPLLIKVFPYDTSLGKEDKDLFDYAFLNVLYELFQSSHYSIETILEYKDYNWIAVLKWNLPPEPYQMEEICASFIQKANQFLRCDACCNIATVSALPAVHPVIRQLILMNEELINSRNQIFFLENYNYQEAAYIPPDLGLLEELLNQSNPAAFFEEIHRYLHSLVNNQSMNASLLRLFRLDLVQLVYSFLKSKEIEAHKLYTGRTNDQLFIQSLNSIEDMVKYLTYLVNTATKYRDFAEQPRSVVEEIQQYISRHYGDDLTRMSLAETVYLNPDYLARLFKKETGISLGTYIIEARIRIAKHLLKTTPMSVNAIASKVGYSNYSYFSKLFKQETGCTPYEYRNLQ